MFDNIGGKIKTLVKILCWLGIIASCIIGLLAMQESVIAGLITAIFGSLASWISSFFAYAFGELVENSSIIAQNTSKYNTTPAKSNPAPVTTPYAPVNPATPSGNTPVFSAPPAQQSVQYNDDNSWTCPKCSRRNLANRDSCWSCGFQK